MSSLPPRSSRHVLTFLDLPLPQNESFVFYSSFTEAQLIPGAEFLIEQLAQPEFEQQYVSKKYASKKFLKASTFARDWARTHLNVEN